MIWKIEPKSFVYPTGSATVTSILINAKLVDRMKDDIYLEFFISFNAHALNDLNTPVAGTNLSAVLTSTYLIDGLKTTILANTVGYTEADQETKEAMELSAMAQATAQILQVSAGLLFGSFAESYQAATILANMYEYVLLPIENQ